jgi:hypothetical protein
LRRHEELVLLQCVSHAVEPHADPDVQVFQLFFEILLVRVTGRFMDPAFSDYVVDYFRVRDVAEFPGG